MLRNGDLLPPAEDTYDPNADLAAHSKSHKRPIEEKETYLNAEQLKELQRVQRERSQVCPTIPVGCSPIELTGCVSVRSLPGWKDEVDRNGHQAELWSPNGRK